MIYGREKGFTLIEMVISILVFGVIAGLAVMPLRNMILARDKISDKVTRDADAIFALEKIGNEIRFVPTDATIDPAILCMGDGVAIIHKKDTDEFHYDYDESSNKLTADIKRDGVDVESLIFTDVKSFRCARVQTGDKTVLNLYELTLEFNKGKRTYRSRAYHRGL